jgi:hypothetical protein
VRMATGVATSSGSRTNRLRASQRRCGQKKHSGNHAHKHAILQMMSETLTGAAQEKY